jgi:gliding motility-associated-like protein
METDSVYAGEDVTISYGAEITLAASSGLPFYSWAPGDNLSCANCPSPVAGPLETTTYIVTATDSNGCLSVDSVTIIVDAEGRAFVPNCFSPNGDGFNDYFRISNEGLMEFSLKIYNRWGRLLFETENPEALWDGTGKSGKPATPGTYFYILKAQSPLNNFSETGAITLIRE